MTFSTRLTTFAILSSIYCQVLAASASTFRAEIHNTYTLASGLELQTFHPQSTFKTFGTGVDHPLSKRDNADIKESAISFLQSHLGVNPETVSYKSGYSGETAKHVYVGQTHNGIPVANAVANVAFNHDNKVVSVGSSFVTPNKVASATPSVSLDKTISVAEAALDGTYNGHPASVQYITKEDGSLVLTRSVQIRNKPQGTWYDAFVDAHSGELVHVTDFVGKATYLVLPIQKENLTLGFETLTDPWDIVSSPLGWHSDGTTNYTDTIGNNVIAFKDATETASTNASSTPLNFIYKQDPTVQPTVQINVDAARTNVFYVVNTVHDIMYRYGFTEASFNFQKNNFGKGGKGNDPVQVSVQNSAGTDGSDFATPPDGQMPLMRMFLWDYTEPKRDGSLENDIIVHENTHGLTNRMTGGGTAACLQTVEAQGLGEGWSDAFAEWTEHNSSAVPDYFLGSYVMNWAPGARSRPYSTSMTVNPFTYASRKNRTEPHVLGEVWANLLHNVYAALVNALGWSAKAKTDPTGSEGNIVFLHLFVDALALQPCNPAFLDARDAWIQADANRYNGAHRCLLWKTFASRGFGTGAQIGSYVDSNTIPDDC